MNAAVKAKLVLWLFTYMNTWNPVSRVTRSHVPEAKETLEEAESRYMAIASAIVDVAYNEKEKPVFSGEYGRGRTASLLASVALFESGYRRDVDFGIGRLGRGDGGRSWCMMQINIGTGTVPDSDPIVSTWTGKDLVSDRYKCFTAGLHIMRRSMAACASLPLRYKLSAYTTGKCQKEAKAESRMLKAFSMSKPPIKDGEAMIAGDGNLKKRRATKTVALFI